MDAHSELLLKGVHPSLAKVIRAAAQTPQPFEVTYGLRTLAAEAEAVRTGHSMTMHSRHLAHEGSGLAYAVDVTPLDHGALSFEKGHEAHFYGAVAGQIMGAAHKLLIPLEWGGDWTSFKDWGHFQLPWKEYP